LTSSARVDLPWTRRYSRAMIRGIKGVKDILPDEIGRWQFIESVARRLAETYGFREIRVPTFEVTELFARSIGASTDIVEKEMYTFADRDGTSLTLRPEATAGVARAYIEHNLTASPTAQKLYYFGPMFRHERPQAGRLRQFHQFGVESFGCADPAADVEVIALLWRFFAALGLPDLTLEINSLGETGDRPAYKTALVEFLKQHTENLCPNCRRRMEANPLRVLDCKVPACRTATEGAPKLTDHLSAPARTHFDEVLVGLKVLDIPYVLNPRLVRGLDYYTLTTFEVTTTHLGAQNAIGAGGRYDGLMETLGGPKTSAVGFAVGLERIALALSDKPGSAPPKLVYVAGFGAQGRAAGLRLLYELRALGVRADSDFRALTLKAHMKQADRLGATLTAIAGDDEAAKCIVLIRDMSTKEQAEFPLSSASQNLSVRLNSA